MSITCLVAALIGRAGKGITPITQLLSGAQGHPTGLHTSSTVATIYATRYTHSWLCFVLLQLCHQPQVIGGINLLIYFRGASLDVHVHQSADFPSVRAVFLENISKIFP